jgi:hypothetical protein
MVGSYFALLILLLTNPKFITAVRRTYVLLRCNGPRPFVVDLAIIIMFFTHSFALFAAPAQPLPSPHLTKNHSHHWTTMIHEQTLATKPTLADPNPEPTHR